MSAELLTDRQRLILGLVVQEYVESAKPVGSKRIVEQYGLDLSSATVRNEMGRLVELGFLRQPHTSAGRVPTEQGYRYFVRQLMQPPALPASTKQTITHQFYQARHDVDQWMRLAASVLANQAKGASLVTAPYAKQARYKHLELILTTGRQVLMVLVLMSGKVLQQMLVLKEPVSQERLSEIALQLNGLYHSKDLEAFGTLPKDLELLGQDIYKLVADEINRAEHALTGEVYHDGWANVLAEPEFQESETARKALRVLEERPLLENLLAQTVVNAEIGGVQVLIGGEGQWEEISECSLVLARYGMPRMATGILGVLGPIRMSYGNAVSTVNFVAGLMSDLVAESMSSEQ